MQNKTDTSPLQIARHLLADIVGGAPDNADVSRIQNRQALVIEGNNNTYGFVNEQTAGLRLSQATREAYEKINSSSWGFSL
jgi:hypothetical protein